MSEWEGTPWAGTPATSGSVTVVEPKAVTGDFAAHVEYGTYLSGMGRTPQELMKRAQAAYRRNPWIGAAEGTVTRKVTGLPWHLENQDDEEYEVPLPGPVRVALDLLEKPQAELEPEYRQAGIFTRRNLWSITSRHIGLCGMAYWFLDQLDAARIPAAILYVNPARVWPVAKEGGRVVGWVLDAKDDQGRGGVPLELDELLPFYLDPPDFGAYGSGLFERALLKSQITDLADRHAAYILGTGGRIPGIVSPKEGTTIGEEQYKTLVAEFRQVNEAPDAAKRTTVLRGPIEFHETAATPDDLNLVELDKMNRDDIFATWGVPPSQAGVVTPGGLNSGERGNYEEAVLMQGPVHDRVVAIRETIQYGLLDRWQKIGVTIDLEIEEPEFDDKAPQFEIAARAKELPLKNRERRELVGLDPFGDERDEEVWLPINLQSVYTIQPVEAKARKTDFLGLRKIIGERWTPKIRKALEDLLATQRAEVAARVRKASPATIERQKSNGQAWFDQARESKRLNDLLVPIVAEIAESVSDRVGELLGSPSGKAAIDLLTPTLVRKLGGRIVGITSTTQDAVQAAILSGYEEGLSPLQIAERMESLPAFDLARAETVARTETMFAYNEAALGSYQEYGVGYVEAIDGDTDDECRERSGNRYSIYEASRIEDHPNGTLDWLPVIEYKARTEDEVNAAEVRAIVAEMMGGKGRIHMPSVTLSPVIQVPEASVQVNVPESHPVVNVTTPTMSFADMPPPNVTVNVPESPPAVVNVTTPEAKATLPQDIRIVSMPDRLGRKAVKRDPYGRVTEVVEEEGDG